MNTSIKYREIDILYHDEFKRILEIRYTMLRNPAETQWEIFEANVFDPDSNEECDFYDKYLADGDVSQDTYLLERKKI